MWTLRTQRNIYTYYYYYYYYKHALTNTEICVCLVLASRRSILRMDVFSLPTCSILLNIH